MQAVISRYHPTMANYLILNSCVGGLTEQITLTGSTVVPLASAVTPVQDAKYFYQNDVAADSNLGDAGVITRLLGFGAIQLV